MKYVRIYLGVSVVIVVLVLVLLPKPNSQRSRVNQAIADGLLATLPPPETESLRRLLVGVLESAGQPPDVSVNRLNDDGYLSVITYRSDQPHAFNFGPGNAVYDASTDTIFVDEGLVDMDALIGVDSSHESAEFPVGSYLAFVLAHELGHRILHAGITGTENFAAIQGDGDHRVELEADAYALKTLNELLTGKQADIIHASLEQEVEGIGLNLVAYSGGDRLYAVLAGMSFRAASVYSVGNTPFSPVFSDRGHPPLVQRLNRLLSNDELFTGLSPDLVAHRQVTMEWLRRFSETGEQPRVQIYVDRPIRSLNQVGEQWCILSTTGYGFVQVQPDQDASQGARTQQAVDWRRYSTEAAAIIKDGLPHVFRDGLGELILADLKTGRMVRMASDSPTVIDGPAGEFGFIRYPPQPADWLYAIGEDSFHLYDGTWRRIANSQLYAAVSASLKREGFRVQLRNAADDRMYGILLTGEQGSEEAIGWCAFAIDDFGKLLTAQLFREPWPYQSTLSLFAPNAPEFTIFFVKEYGEGGPSVSMIAADGTLRKSVTIKTHDAALRGKSELWMTYPSVWMVDAACHPDGFLFLSFAEDSVYVVDTQGNQSIAMHPYAVVVSMRDGRMPLIPFLHSHTAYVVNPVQRHQRMVAR